MVDALVFNNTNALDFCDVRLQVLRIPEVIQRMNQAQDVWDSIGSAPFNFHNFLTSESDSYFKSTTFKEMGSAIIQIGLFDRYLKKYRRPQFLVGSGCDYSTVKVCAGKMGFEQMLLQNEHTQTEVVQLYPQQTPVLSGQMLDHYCAYKKEESGYEELSEKEMNIVDLIKKLSLNYDIKKIINVGPGDSIDAHSDLFLANIQILESIDLDPMLSWFWPSLKNLEAVAT